MSKHHFFATTARGLEQPLAAELRSLHLQQVKPLPGGVRFVCDWEEFCIPLLWSRLAFRIMLQLGEAEVDSYDTLYEAAAQLPWQDHFRPGQTFAVEASTRGSPLTHSHFGALRVKDAIVDVLRDRTGSRPDVDPEHPDLTIQLVVHETRASLMLDLSTGPQGTPLFMRGYRVKSPDPLLKLAPLKEPLAAGLLALSGWHPDLPLRDPFCGTGTLVIEAANQALRRAPGLGREFAYQRHPGFGSTSAITFRNRSEEARSKALTVLPAPIVGMDHNRDVLELAQAGAQRAGLEGLVPLLLRDVRAMVPGPPGGLIVTNPPYGERLGRDKLGGIEGIYRAFGAKLSETEEREAWVFSAFPRTESCLARAAKARVRLFNGPLETWLYGFELAARRTRK